MKDDKLEKILKEINLNDCEPLICDHIYFTKKRIKTRNSNGDGTYQYSNEIYEFLIIVEEGEKKGIILRCGFEDVHWFVLKKWRGLGVLSGALRTGIMGTIWPENEEVSCRYSWRDKMIDRKKKYNMTQHLATLANLKMKD